MYLIGDIGNTETKICLFNNKKKLLNKKILNTNNLKKKNISKNLRFINSHHKKIDKVLFSSVVPNVFENIKRFIKKNLRKEIKELKQVNLNKILKVDVNMKQVGSDRLANALSVINGKDNFIILDFGTATTFDVVVQKTYKGGIIAPGIKISLNTLSDKATLIPKINLKKIKKVIGSDTISAVRSGFFWGYAGLIDNVVNLIKKEIGKSFKLVITGGFSDLFKNSIKTKLKQDKNITINGLIKISNLIK